MTILTREQHCLIAGLDVETFKSMKKRGQIPKFDEMQTSEGQRGHEPSATLLLMMALEFHHACGLPRDLAAQVAWSCTILPAHLHRSPWPAVARTSLRIARGETVNDPIMCGLIDRGVGVDAHDHDRKFALNLGDDNRVIRFHGVMKDLVKRAPIRRLILVNLSEIVARMRIAADENAIDLKSFWDEGC
jgi:hypothetical protein